MQVNLLNRPWLGIPFGFFGVTSLLYFWWLITVVERQDVQIAMMKSEAVRNNYARESLRINADPPIDPGKPGTVCETIHICILYMGSSKIQYLKTMLKSMLYYRQNPLHFHFIVDGKSEYTLRTLFDVWNLPDVRSSYYNGEKYYYHLKWIPNKHYAGAYTFIKLLLPSNEILPVDLTKVIVLDSDLIFFSDVADLWSMFRNMTDKQFIGLVENESGWYSEAEHWPALRQGFNMGVMLLNRDTVQKKTNWTALWQDALQSNLKQLKTTTLAEQDVMNAVIKNNSWILYEISCHYNVQMSTKTIAKNCYGEDQNSVKILHWNSPYKDKIEVQDANYFRSRQDIFAKIDVTLFKEKLHRCWDDELYSARSRAGKNLLKSILLISFLPLLLMIMSV